MPLSGQCSRYAVDTGASQLSFEASSTLHPVRGQSTAVRGTVSAAWNDHGTLASDPAPTMRVELNVESLSSGNALQDREMWKLIDSKRFPIIAAELRDIAPGTPSGTYAASGDITLAGRVRRYSGSLTVLHDGDRVTVDGTLTLDITDYGLQPPRLLMFKVSPQVRVNLHLVAASAA
jgi:polyisoprenoid-binding protein YceI